ncbi:hypothetical protein QTI92_12925 [Clostridium perfringens]|uniref:hypothetical protein n=1 Tax=Clostridium perfringens TaxID=1502 RepID=UPI001A29EE56|nr:hypothetical protein [Clostridium perfringens]EJT6154975.1 hypothetical protein [Clostridium perfringens]MDB2046468.1 hypothetical protein [Clostridium perfringens]MDB2057068.1 hypothetical protein [Clostridium perfringens]MDH2340558.1 hypothetical protein [Clostridium perfringens]MDM0961624.1 hypothetical protein [Clostridium perfringens]
MKLENIYASINNIDDMKPLFNAIENSIRYTNSLFEDYRHRKVAIEDTELIKEDLRKIDKGIKKLTNCNLCSKEEIIELNKRREKYNDELMEINTRILCQD